MLLTMRVCRRHACMSRLGIVNQAFYLLMCTVALCQFCDPSRVAIHIQREKRQRFGERHEEGCSTDQECSYVWHPSAALAAQFLLCQDKCVCWRTA